MRICYLTRLLFIASVPMTVGAGDLNIDRGLYEIAARTVMPHLEEMRRNAVIHTRCLDGDDLTAIFPVMDQRALKGCHLGFVNQVEGVFHYTLDCQTELVATGTAEIEVPRDRIVGQLKVKMGGKNMTFSQFVEGTWRGACEGALD